MSGGHGFPSALMTVAEFRALDGDTIIRLARSWGLKNGYKGNTGGWIYRRHPDGMIMGHAICQGWWSFGKIKAAQILGVQP